MGQSPQYYQRNNLDSFNCHTTDHGGANNSIGNQTGRNQHLQLREIIELTKELRDASFKALVMPVEDGAR